jgi:Domain of unknown function (DUF4404)
MDKERLLQTLAELRAEVAKAESVDPETAELLESAMRDLQAELNKRGIKPSPDIAPASSGLKDALLKFESEHPQLSDAVGKVADALAAMGI